MPHPELEIHETALGGSSLARAALSGSAGVAGWYQTRPEDAAAWAARIAETRSRFPSGDWLARLEPAIAARGAAAERLGRVARAGGVLVTTGQQPGLFGGPAYSWIKAVSALAFADELERTTGVPAAPLFWAATDDADYAEAAATWLGTPDGGERIALPALPDSTVMLAEVPLPESIVQLRERLRAASGSVVDPRPLDLLDSTWVPDATIGAAYLGQLRGMLEPLGIPVLDAAHPAARAAMEPLVRRALEQASQVDDRLRERTREIEESGYSPQVALVDGLSLVFEYGASGRQRVPLESSAERARDAEPGSLGPNVLLRPLVEQSMLPTVSYVAGPGEIAYFAQVSAVASALGEPAPAVLPRFSTRIVEPHVRRALDRLELEPDDLLDPHAPERRLARAAVRPELSETLAELRESIGSSMERMVQIAESARDGDGIPPVAVFEGAARQLEHRVERLERRIAAAAARADHSTRRDLAMLRGALAPGGSPQERALNLVPLLARHGTELLVQLAEAARPHASRWLDGAPDTGSRRRPVISATR